MEKKIKSLTTIHKDIETDDDFNIISDFDSYTAAYTEYSETGKVVLEKSYNSGGEIQEKIEYRYDENDRLKEQIMYYDEEEIVERRVCEYDDKAMLVRINKHYSEGQPGYTLYFYNEAGQLTEKKSFGHDHEHEETEIFEFNGGMLVREARYDEDMKLVYEQKIVREDDTEEKITTDIDTGTTRHTDEFNEEGKRVKTLIYDKKDRLISRLLYFYEDNNTVRLTEEKATGTDTTVLHYNDRGEVVLQEDIDSNDFYKSRVIRTFDNDYNILSTQVYINNYGKAPDVNYLLEFIYEYYE